MSVGRLAHSDASAATAVGVANASSLHVFGHRVHPRPGRQARHLRRCCPHDVRI